MGGERHDRYTLARRLAIDLTGLPPTIEMVDRFVNDKSADAYEKYLREGKTHGAYVSETRGSLVEEAAIRRCLLLAERTGYAVVPVAHNAGVFWARRGLHKYPGVIDVVIGRPITTQGRSP
jgi:1-acyl-sn-glycerol-3-phosphate acyltransferase